MSTMSYIFVTLLTMSGTEIFQQTAKLARWSW